MCTTGKILQAAAAGIVARALTEDEQKQSVEGLLKESAGFYTVMHTSSKQRKTARRDRRRVLVKT